MTPRRYRGAGLMVRTVVCLMVGCLVILGCRGPEPTAPDVVAEVGGESVRYEEFESYVETTTGDLSGAYGSDVLSGLFDEFLREKCLLARALDEQLVPPDAGARKAAQVLIEAYPPPLPQPEEVRKFFEASRADFVRARRLHVRQILVDDRVQAEAALARLRAGEPFVDVARALSVDPSAERGGNQGWLVAEDLPPAFVDSIVTLEAGEVSEIVVADYGYHLFLVDAIEPEARDFESLEMDATRALDAERRRQRLTELVDDALSRYNVVIFERNLPFNYQGDLAADHAG